MPMRGIGESESRGSDLGTRSARVRRGDRMNLAFPVGPTNGWRLSSLTPDPTKPKSTRSNFAEAVFTAGRKGDGQGVSAKKGGVADKISFRVGRTSNVAINTTAGGQLHTVESGMALNQDLRAADLDFFPYTAIEEITRLLRIKLGV